MEINKIRKKEVIKIYISISDINIHRILYVKRVTGATQFRN